MRPSYNLIWKIAIKLKFPRGFTNRLCVACHCEHWNTDGGETRCSDRLCGWGWHGPPNAVLERARLYNKLSHRYAVYIQVYMLREIGQIRKHQGKLSTIVLSPRQVPTTNLGFSRYVYRHGICWKTDVVSVFVWV